ncbi:MAG TPA: IS110 family transposase [Planctomycetota bacterium]|nr:IS110 family transposase [Planctomycetota bacterium]
MTETTASPVTLPTSPVILVTLTTGLDLGDRTTHFCTLDEQRQVVGRGKFKTTREALAREFGGIAPRRIVIEAGSQSLWISHLLRELGHEAMVVDPRRVQKLVAGNRKTDRRDAESLARLAVGVPELLGAAHHRTLEAQADLSMLRSRDILVRMRTKLVCHVRGILKSFGFKLPACSASCFHRRAADLIPANLQPALKPVLEALGDLDRRIDELDASLQEVAAVRRPEVKVLRQVSGVGPVVAMAYALTVGDPRRFRRSRDVGAWVGLTPDKRASGDSDPQLSIHRRGDGYLRRLLVVASHYILGPFGKDSDLRRYGLRLCERGGSNGKKRAVVAVARKLAVLLHRLWVSGVPYEPLRNSTKQAVA